MTDQQETTTVSVSEYESAGSLSNGLVKNVRIAPRSVERFEKTADSLSLNSASFKIPISDNLLLSRRIILEMPITLSVNAGPDKVRHFYASPRSDALNRIITNCSVKVNGSSVVSRPSDFCEIVQFFSRESQYLHHGSVLAESPNTCDILFSAHVPGYDGATNPVPDLVADLSHYHWRTTNFDLGFPSRASVPFTKVGATAANNTGATSSSLTFYVRYAIKNPVFSMSPYEVLSNINDLEVNLTFNSSQFLNKLFFHPIIYKDNAGTTSEVLPTASIGTEASKVKLIGYTINPSMPDMIPTTSLIPATEFVNFDYPVQGEVADNGDIKVLHTSINVSQVPSMIFISCVPQDNSLSSKMSDYFSPISNLSLQVNNRTFNYSLNTDKDFYEMNTKNGLKSLYQSFVSSKLTDNYGDTTGTFDGRTKDIGIGAPLCFTCNDIGGELRSGVMEQFKLEVRYTAKNTTGLPSVANPAKMFFVSRVTLVMDQTLIIQKGSPVRVLNGISPEEFNQAVSEGKFVTLGEDGQDETEVLLGGSISSMFRDAGRFLIRGLNVANQVVQSASEIYPDRVPYPLAYESNRANQLAQNLNQNLNLGAGSMMGGSRLDMLRASGVLR
jgi:hypothetical protein